MNTTKLYNEHKNLICDQASRASKKYGFDYDEMFAEGNFIFVEAVRDYKKEGGTKFSTYLYMRLHHRLRFYCKDLYSIREKEVASNFLIAAYSGAYRENHTDRIFFNDALDQVNEIERQVINIILNPVPGKRKYRGQGVTKHSIKKELQSIGWKDYEVKEAFNHIKEVFDL